MGNINIYGSCDFTPDGSIYEKVMIAGSGDIRGPLNCGSLTIFGSGDVLGSVRCEGDVLISGSGDINGDLTCKTLKIAGSGDIGGSVDCEKLEISGSGDISRNVEASGRVSISGSGDIGGDVKCGGDVALSGSGDVSGTVACRTLVISGSANIEKSVEVHKLEMSGSGDIKGDASCEEALISGSSSVSGLLNAESIVVELGEVDIGEIGCTTLTVRDKNCGGNKSLTCRVIEGDNISLIKTSAKTVRGRNVVVGDGCKIDTVEYSESLTVSDNAEVGKTVKL